jgi:hypothetical protein
MPASKVVIGVLDAGRRCRPAGAETKEVIMKRINVIKSITVALALLVAFAFFPACDQNNAAISFSITDAPIDSSTVKAVYLTVSSVAVNESGSASAADSSWIQTAIDPPLAVDLLSLQNGVSAALADIPIKGGTQVNQIRLGVDSVTVIEIDDSSHAATLASATGFKIVNAFQVPLSGEIAVSIDFDVRRSIIANAGGYQVNPAIRAIVDNEAGRITGSVGATVAVAVYAYTNDAYAASEAVPTSEGVTFAGAYSSTLVKADGSYVLAFMDAGTYDLYAVDATGAVVGTIADAVVVSGAVTAAQNF